MNELASSKHNIHNRQLLGCDAPQALDTIFQHSECERHYQLKILLFLAVRGRKQSAVSPNRVLCIVFNDKSSSGWKRDVFDVSDASLATTQEIFDPSGSRN